jgi:hypothetical protein
MTVEYFEAYSIDGTLVAAFRFVEHAEVFVQLMLPGGRVERKTRKVKK